jgi:hypothetical protein
MRLVPGMVLGEATAYTNLRTMADRRCPTPSRRIGCRGFKQPFQRGRGEPLERAIFHGVHYVGPWWTGFLMETPAFTRAKLSDVGVIMAIVRVPLEELLW